MMDARKSAQLALKAETRAELYIGLARARHAVAVVDDLDDEKGVPGFTLFQQENRSKMRRHRSMISVF
jgi:hypothetical protein